MATLEAATVELQQLNGTSDLQLEAMFEQHDAISSLSVSMDQTNIILVDILGVMQDFVRAVPEEISKGYDALLTFQQKQALLASREEDASPLTPDPSSSGGTDDGSKNSGFFKSNFDKGMEKDLGFVTTIRESIADAIIISGSVASLVSKVFVGVGKAFAVVGKVAASLGKVLLTGVKILGTALRGVFAAISLPFALITAALVGLAMGVMGFVEDFQSEEGTFMDKLIAGLGGFVKGFMKLITVPLDLLKDAIAWVAGALGFDEFETMLDGFSFTEGFGEIVDSVVGFVQSIKDWIANSVKDLVNNIGGFFGLDPIFEDKPEPVAAPEQPTPTSEPEVQRSYPVLSPEGEVIGQESTPEAASQKAMQVGGYVGNPTVVAKGPTASPSQVTPETPVAESPPSNKRGKTIGDSPAAAVKVKANGKRGMTIGTAPAAAVKVKSNGKRGMEIDTPKKVKIPEGVRVTAAVKVKANGKRGTTIGSAPAAAVKVKADGKRGMTIDAPKPKKVGIPEGVRVTPAGKYASYNNETNSQAFFSNVQDAVTFITAPIEQAAKMDPYAAKIYEERKQSASKPKRVLRSKSADAEAKSPVVSSLGSPEKRGMTIGDASAAPSEVKSNGKRGMVIGGSDRVAVTDTMRSEQNKLDEKKAESSGGGNTAIVTNTNDNSTSVVNKKSNFVVPSAMDKSDRTDRRSSFRGKAI
jgi:hypothetical protein